MNDVKWNTHIGHRECDNITALIDVFPPETFAQSIFEIESNKNMFESHSLNSVYLQSGPLRECKSLFLTNKNKSLDKSFINTLNFVGNLIKRVSSTANVNASRAYITILGPGHKIYEHCDTASPYFDGILRYQFYFTGDDKTIQLIKGTQFDMRPGFLYLFDHRQIHYYENNSDKDLILLVFDLPKYTQINKSE